MHQRIEGSLVLSLLILGLLFVLAPVGRAQEANSQSSRVSPKVISVDGRLELDHMIRVQVDNLTEWAKTSDPAKLVPFLNGRALRGIYPEEIQLQNNQIQFHLRITPENKKLWSDLLGEPKGIYRSVAFSVGIENQSTFDTVFDLNNELRLTVIPPRSGVISLVVILVVLICFLGLARKTDLIREPGAKPVNGKLKPYSLGRVQMAFWSLLISVSYLVVWLLTDNIETITLSLLKLMGISAMVVVGEAVIDSARNTAIRSPANPHSSAPEQVPSHSHSSAGFLRDILSDDSGYGLHRFQMFAWTIVLGIVFIASVYHSLAMPDFSSTLLGLMGISSGTYIGFKFCTKEYDTSLVRLNSA